MHKVIERLRSRLFGSTSTGLIALLALSGTVAAITSPDVTYQTTKTGYYTINPMTLTQTPTTLFISLATIRPSWATPMEPAFQPA